LFGAILCISYALLKFSDKGIALLSPAFHGSAGFLIPTAVAVLAFFVPGFALSSIVSDRGRRRKTGMRSSQYIAFAIALALFFSSLSFFFAYFFRFSIAFPCYSAATPAATEPKLIWAVFGLIVPVCLEEYFLRGVFYRHLSKYGTALATVSSAVLYAMLQDSMQSFWGALVLGVAFCVITDFTASFAAVPLIRLACILYHSLFSGFIETYSVYGLEYVFLLLNLVILLAACYFILLGIERFIKKGRKFNYKKTPSPAPKNITSFVFNPGMLAFFALYIMCVTNVLRL